MTASAVYLTTLDFDPSWLERLRRRVPGVEVRQRVCASAAELSDFEWADVDVLHTGHVLPTAEQAPRLRWVQLDTSGAEHLATTGWWESPTEITTLGGVAPVPMAEFTVMSLLALAHHQPLVNRLMGERRWPSAAERLASLTPLPVDGATTVIVGYGRIGREIGRLLTGLGMSVVGVSRTGARPRGDGLFDTARATEDPGHRGDPAEVVGVERLPEVLPRADYLVICTPLTARTKGMIGAHELAALPVGACVVNVARGGVVVEDALRTALTEGQVRYASLDVFDDEPLRPDDPWWEHDDVLLSPHVAGLAPRYQEQVLELVASNLSRLLAGEPAPEQGRPCSGILGGCSATPGRTNCSSTSARSAAGT